MINGLLQLLLGQLIGEFTARALNVAVPGPVIGMVVLLVVLRIRRTTAEAGIVRTSDGLLRQLQLLFIPVGAGVVTYLPVLTQAWLPILGALVVA